MSVSLRDDVPVDQALHDTARTVGHTLGRRALQDAGEAGGATSSQAVMDAASDVLSSCAYEPHDEGDQVVLRNCPFHALAQQYRDLMCGMNLSLMTGLTEELEGAGLEARLDPHPGECCVRLIRGATPGAPN